MTISLYFPIDLVANLHSQISTATTWQLIFFHEIKGYFYYFKKYFFNQSTPLNTWVVPCTRSSRGQVLNVCLKLYCFFFPCLSSLLRVNSTRSYLNQTNSFYLIQIISTSVARCWAAGPHNLGGRSANHWINACSPNVNFNCQDFGIKFQSFIYF